MKLTVNGEEKNIRAGITVTELLEECSVAGPDMVSVQLNMQFVDKGKFPEVELHDGDEVEFLYFLGGGTL